MSKAKIFDGHQFVKEKIVILQKKLQEWGRPIKIVSLCFIDDPSSMVYARHKQQLAWVLGIEFILIELKLSKPISEIKKIIKRLKDDESVTGIMVQKPRKIIYNEQKKFLGQKLPDDFISWWQKITETLPFDKDIDGLSPLALAQIKKGVDMAILPATATAIRTILQPFALKQEKILIIGRSDLIGWPLYWYWRNQGLEVEIVGQRGLKEKLKQIEQLKKYTLIISATGQPQLIKKDMLGQAVILIDVGEPQGDIDFNSCLPQARLITPVPGGVGPVTVWALLENSLILSQLHS